YRWKLDRHVAGTPSRDGTPLTWGPTRRAIRARDREARRMKSRLTTPLPSACIPNTMVETAVVLLFGGMDSATALALTIKEGHRVISLTFDYGQRHRKEIDAAERIAKHFRV